MSFGCVAATAEYDAVELLEEKEVLKPPPPEYICPIMKVPAHVVSIREQLVHVILSLLLCHYLLGSHARSSYACGWQQL